MAEQLQFPFPSLDFPGRVTLTAGEIAARLGWTEKHVTDLINEGEMPGIDGSGKGSTRASYRVPVESYRDWITANITGPRRIEMLTKLPKPVVEEIVRELKAFLKTP